MEWAEFYDECLDLLDDIEDLPDECEAKDSWKEKVEGMGDWAKDNGKATDRMVEAMRNIQRGVSRWQRRE